MQDNCWTKDGAIWIGYNVTRNLRDTSVINVPAAVVKVLGDDGTICSPLTVQRSVSSQFESSIAWGVGPFMDRRGVDVGDTLIITVDTELEVAAIQSGSAELLAAYQDGDGWGPRRVLEEATAPSDIE